MLKKKKNIGGILTDVAYLPKRGLIVLVRVGEEQKLKFILLSSASYDQNPFIYLEKDSFYSVFFEFTVIFYSFYHHIKVLDVLIEWPVELH